MAALGQLDLRLPRAAHAGGIVVVTVLLAVLAWQSRGYAALYASPQTLWGYTLQHNPQAWMAHVSLGDAHIQKNEFPEAIDQYEQALRVKSDYLLARMNLGNALTQMGPVFRRYQPIRAGIAKHTRLRRRALQSRRRLGASRPVL